MSTEGGSSLSAGLGFARRAVSSEPPLPRNADDGPKHAAGSEQRTIARADFATQRSARKRSDEVLPSNDFLRDLRREMRRAERSTTALSLVLYRTDSEAFHDPLQIALERLLEALHASKRETDALGHVGKSTVAVLCPDTDDAGARSFIHKLEPMLEGLPYSAVAAT